MMKKLTALTLLSLLSLNHIALANPTTIQNQQAYLSQPLYFHYFKIDVPNDIDLKKTLIKTEINHLDFTWHDIASKPDFDKVIQQRVAYYRSYHYDWDKIFKSCPSHEQCSPENLINLKQLIATLNVNTALYRHYQYPNYSHFILSTDENKLDDFAQSSFVLDKLYGQFYAYFPQQQQYIQSPQIQLSEMSFTNEHYYSRLGESFVQDYLQPVSKNDFLNSERMIVGAMAITKPKWQPHLEYQLASKQYSMNIQIRVEEPSREHQHLIQDTINQLKKDYDLKAITAKLFTPKNKLADMQGKQQCFYAQAKNSQTKNNQIKPYSQVWCNGLALGQDDGFEQPMLSITMQYQSDGSDSQNKQALQAWSQLMTSLKRR
ncbi:MULTISPECIES: hypothetical protein [unclassified Acinetobacter]|uniref:hypothetical protein n=1 Tax=unclassified Acinetobacter TaxID=196816 RepID=UPI0035B7ECEF